MTNKDILEGLPTELQTERAILGAIILHSQDFLPLLARSLQTEDFADRRNQVIWKTLCAMEQKGIYVDRVSLCAFLNITNDLDVVGGLSYITELDTDAAVASMMGLDAYVDNLRQASACRRIIQLCEATTRDVQLYRDLSILDKVENQLRKLSNYVSRRKAMGSGATDIEETGGIDTFLREQIATVETPFAWLTDLLTGGLRTGQMAVLAARPSVGKTALAMQFATHFASLKPDNYVGVISLEQAPRELLLRLACGDSKLKANVVTDPTCHENVRRRFVQSLTTIANLPIFYDRSHARTLADITHVIREMAADVPLKLVVIDYLQLIQSITRSENRNVEVTYISRGIKELAQQLNVPILVLSQLKRLRTEDDRPGLEDLRDSGSIEQDADVVMFLSTRRAWFGQSPRITRLEVAKQRNGAVGRVMMHFEPAATRFAMPPQFIPDPEDA
jgi:replicative DNA helicase